MSVPSGGATNAPQCACSNISIMQLFHELKQQFPGVPDHVVSTTISSHCHDRSACQLRLECEAKKYISHLYPSSSLSGTKKEIKDIQSPQQCPNQLIISKTVDKPKSIHVSSVLPQKALSSYQKLDENQNENIISQEIDTEEELRATDSDDDTSGSLEDKESFDTDSKDVVKDVNSNDCNVKDAQTFQIIKSNKVTSGLNRKLCDQNTKQSERKAAIPISCSQDDNKDVKKVKRPTTLELPTESCSREFNIRQHDKESSSKPSTSLNQPDKLDKSTCNCHHKCCDKASQESEKGENNQSAETHFISNESFPLNVSVNLNCRMDLRPGANTAHHNLFQDPWQGSYSSPTNITSLNLTVCTPTGVAEDKRNPGLNNPSDPGQRGFEGHVQITVSPASAQPPPFRVPPSVVPSRSHYSPYTNIMQSSPSSSIENLLQRQRERLKHLQDALMEEHNLLMTMKKHISILEDPVPKALIIRLKPDVKQLEHLCEALVRQLDKYNSDGNFYDKIYPGQRQTNIPINRDLPHQPLHRRLVAEEADSSWQCHMCTFRNNTLLNKCEQCDMPRIISGTQNLGSGYVPTRAAPLPPDGSTSPLRHSRAAPPPPIVSLSPDTRPTRERVETNTLHLTPSSLPLNEDSSHVENSDTPPASG